MAYGDIDQPITLSRLLYTTTIIPGDEIRIRAGTYLRDPEITAFSFVGTESLPVTIRAYPGERVVIDGAVMVLGHSQILRDLEVTWTGWPETRETTTPGSDAPEFEPERFFTIYGTDAKIINCIVHDLANGIQSVYGAPAEIYGCISIYNGWQGPDRGHGHGGYNQNNSTVNRIRLENNIYGFNFAFGIKMYGQTQAGSSAFDVIDNISMYNGEIYTYPTPTAHSYLNIEGGSPWPQVSYNCLWDGNLTIGAGSIWGAGLDTSVFRNNYFQAMRQFLWKPGHYAAFYNSGIYSSVFEGNTFVGEVSDITAYPERGLIPMELNTTIAYPRTSGKFLKLVPNKYDANRAHFGFCNYDQDDTLTLDLTEWSSVLPGDTVYAYNILNYPDDVQELIVNDNNEIVINVEAENRTPIGPLYWNYCPNPFPLYGAFLLKSVPLSTPPEITEGASITVAMSKNGTPVPFALTLHATDPDEDATLTWSVLTQPGHGVATATGAGLTQVVTYSPTLNYDGTDSFVVRVTDEFNRSDEITVNVIISRTVYAMHFTPASRSMIFTRTA